MAKPGKPFSDRDVEHAGRVVTQYGSLRAAARGAGVNYSTLQGRYKEFQRRAQSAPAAEAVATEPLANSERLKFEDRIRTLEKKLREANAAELTATKIGEYYFDLKERPVKEPDWTITLGGAGGVAGVPVTHWSDWHYAEHVNPAQVEGANEFSIPIFERRFKTLVERTVDLCENHMTGKNYPGIVVNLGGDMLSGNIHEELAQTNERETIPSVLDLAGHIVWGLNRYADYFGRVFVVGVPGNHGRNTKKPQAKNACVTSFDWMIYKIVQRQLAGDDRFQFFIPDGYDAYYKVFGHRFLLTHGDRIGSRGGDGFIGAIGPIMRGANKLRLSYAARGREIDTVMMGHWHNEFNIPGLRVNNTLKGYDEWAMSMRFSPTAPSQDLFFIHPKRGVTASWPVQLEKRDHGQDTKGWVSWRQE